MTLRMLVLASALAAATGATAAPRGFTVEDLVNLERVGSPALSPDATRVVYTVRTTNLDKNRGNTQLWMIDLRAATPTPVRLTQADASSSDPAWSPATPSTSCRAARARRRCGACRWPAARPRA
jgi:dipeptidyl aminopeptidase/acylaminoacyl peptidase